MVAPDVTLDREDNYEYTLTVNATDNVNGPGTKRSTFVAVSITSHFLLETFESIVGLWVEG